jgi:hypothetical protein
MNVIVFNNVRHVDAAAHGMRELPRSHVGAVAVPEIANGGVAPSKPKAFALERC